MSSRNVTASQTKPGSISHMAEQPSPSFMLLSSHSSLGARNPSPHTGASRQHRAPPPAELDLVTALASFIPSAPQAHGAPSVPQRFPDDRSSGLQLAATPAPKSPQPKRSLAPTPHSPAPGPLCRVTKNKFEVAAAPVQSPVPLDAITSATSLQTCQPGAHKSATLQPVPAVFAAVVTGVSKTGWVGRGDYARCGEPA